MTSMDSKAVFPPRQSISEDLIVYIKQQILNGQLNPGDRIVETKLAGELGISQTPVREAIRRLQGEGIITVVPNKGPMVCTLDKKDVFEIYSIRSMLEGQAIRLAVLRASDRDIAELETFYEQMKEKLDDFSVEYLLDDSFHIHETIIKLSQHSRLISTYQSISFQILLANRLLGTKKTKQTEVEQHWELIEALKRRDTDSAEQTMRRHIYRSYCDFVELNGLDASPEELDEKTWL
ncbi:GntR family transcriptional regulator [Paenibacillus sp. HJGM_3]|uniref:GntR family transcriptional regulator n=1 Tax=Paenibacillus sp. HJGM_3 TaxID=3379816 RepID=UPI00385AA314